MGTRSIEITLISGRDLKSTSKLSKTKAYAVAWISNDFKSRQWTPVDKDNGTNPTWNHVLNFILNEAHLQEGRLFLEIAIYTDAIFSGDKEIGRVRIPLREFLEPAGSNRGSSLNVQFVAYHVQKPSGKPKGALNLSVKLAKYASLPAITGSYGAPTSGPLTVYPVGLYGAARAELVSAYPGYPPADLSSSLPPNYQYPPSPYPRQAGYPPLPPYYQGYPPLSSYYQGYPPPQPYLLYQGYPPTVLPVQQPRRSSLGTGLIGGALGCLLLNGAF